MQVGDYVRVIGGENAGKAGRVVGAFEVVGKQEQADAEANWWWVEMASGMDAILEEHLEPDTE